MPAATHRARYSVLNVSLPAWRGTAGVLLEDPANDRLYLRLRRDWEDIAGEDAEVLSALEHDLTSKAKEMGATALLAQLEDTLSNAMTVSDRRDTVAADFDRALNRLYREHVRSTVHEYITHLPRYSLAAAAGPFRDNREVEAEGWEESPQGARFGKEHFIAEVHGQSMEPVIPDGSLCVFRKFGAGSRQGKLVLVEELGRGGNDRYTVKRYSSQKSSDGADEWRHARIHLESLNPDFPSWDLDPEEDRYRILAEFVQVLD
jgi:phage repressor protein C with HTH and peptisase S24 domain